MSLIGNWFKLNEIVKLLSKFCKEVLAAVVAGIVVAKVVLVDSNDVETCLEVDSIRVVAISLTVVICVVVWIVEIVEAFSVTVDNSVVIDVSVVVVVGAFVDVIVAGFVCANGEGPRI